MNTCPLILVSWLGFLGIGFGLDVWVGVFGVLLGFRWLFGLIGWVYLMDRFKKVG